MEALLSAIPSQTLQRREAGGQVHLGGALRQEVYSKTPQQEEGMPYPAAGARAWRALASASWGNTYRRGGTPTRTRWPPAPRYSHAAGP